MRKALGILAVLGLVAAPVMADLSPSGLSPVTKSLSPAQSHGSVAPIGNWTYIYYTGYGSYPVPTGSSQITAAPSDLIYVTFAFDWPFYTYVNGLQLWSSLVWDNSEVEVISVQPVGPFLGNNNYATLTSGFWAGPSSGTLQVGDVLGTGVPLWQNFNNPITIPYTISAGQIYPFMRVALHVKNVIADGNPDILIGSAQLLFWTAGTTTYGTGGAIGATSFGEDIVPEPASLSLLGFGVVAIGAGVWRRRRR
jgi:hypothetical protein